MTALKLLNNEINGKESKHIKEQNLHDEETPWVTGSDNKTMPRNKCLRTADAFPVVASLPPKNSYLLNKEFRTYGVRLNI